MLILGLFELIHRVHLSQLAGDEIRGGEVPESSIHRPLEQRVVSGRLRFRMSKPDDVTVRPPLVLRALKNVGSDFRDGPVRVPSGDLGTQGATPAAFFMCLCHETKELKRIHTMPPKKCSLDECG